MMGLLRAVAKSNRWIQTSIQNQGLTLPLCRQFSTQMETPQKDNSSDSFLRNPSSGSTGITSVYLHKVYPSQILFCGDFTGAVGTSVVLSPTDTTIHYCEPAPLHYRMQEIMGLVYGRLFVTGKHTRKSDILNMLGSSRLSPDDVRFEYNMNYAPVSVMIQFPTRNSYEATLREGNRKGGLFRMERVGRQQWDTLPRYDGKTILLLGVPRHAVAEDVERFLAGCQYDASAIQMFGRPQRASDRPQTRTVFVEFPSQAKATHAFITKNRGFCLNNQITVRLLQ